MVSQRDGNPNRATYLWRTYSHAARYENSPLEYNAKSLAGAQATIWQVCRATTAAPWYFKKIKILSHKHMDGGVGNNNPSDIAWNEARQMSNKDEPDHGKASLLLSLGTGQSRSESRFRLPLVSLLTWAMGQIAETDKTHIATKGTAESSDALYFRFTVPSGEDGTDEDLSDIKLSECKKTSKTPGLLRLFRHSKPESTSAATPRWYTQLAEAATEEVDGGFKPHKYTYTTFDALFARTRKYYETGQYNGEYHVDEVIRHCADRIVHYARERQAADPGRWRRFVSHPDPAYRKDQPPPPT